MYCIFCGNKIKEGALFCVFCGKSVASQSQPKDQTTLEQSSPEAVRLPLNQPEHQTPFEQPTPSAGYPSPVISQCPAQKTSSKKKGLVIASIAAGCLVVIGIALFVIFYPRSGSDFVEDIAEPEIAAETGTISEPEIAVETPAPTTDEPIPVDDESVPMAEEPETTPEPEFSPVSYSAYGNGYSITGYDIGTNTDGSTTVILYGNGYNVLPIRDNRIRIPVWASIISDGVEYSSLSCSIDGDQITYEFDFYGTPDMILAVNGETDDIIVSIDVNDDKSENSGAGASKAPGQEDSLCYAGKL